MERTHYTIMGVSIHASAGDVRRAYLRRARERHPDMPGGSDEAMAELNAAFAILSDASARRTYDRELGVHARKAERDRRDGAEAPPVPGRGQSREDLDPRGPGLSGPLRVLTKLVPLLFVAAFGVLIVGSVIQVQALFAAGIAMGVASIVLFALMPFFAMSSRKR